MNLIILILFISATLLVLTKVIYGFSEDLKEIDQSNNRHFYSSNVIEIKNRYKEKGLMIYNFKKESSHKILDYHYDEVIQESEYTTEDEYISGCSI
jgi:hypothetical protein